jgi:hypothetical protein
MWGNVLEPSNFVKDVKHGEMPAVSWIIPPESYNEHPGGGKSTCAGENWTVHQVNTIMRSEFWRTTAIVVVWDDFGGFYDPVEPPQYDVMGLGPRTPALIISPYTRQGSNPDGGAVDGTTYEFSSVLAFIEQLFGLDPMTDRDGQADPLSGAFDFEHPNFDKLIPVRGDLAAPAHDRQARRLAVGELRPDAVGAEREWVGRSRRLLEVERGQQRRRLAVPMRELGEPPVVLDEPKHAGELAELVADESLPRVGADHEQRDPDPETEVVDLRRRHVVVEPAVVVPGDEDRGGVPLRALHDRVHDLGGPVLPVTHAVLGVLRELEARGHPRHGW